MEFYARQFHVDYRYHLLSYYWLFHWHLKLDTLVVITIKRYFRNIKIRNHFSFISYFYIWIIAFIICNTDIYAGDVETTKIGSLMEHWLVITSMLWFYAVYPFQCSLAYKIPLSILNHLFKFNKINESYSAVGKCDLYLYISTKLSHLNKQWENT